MSIIPQKHCTECGALKPIAEFHKQAKSPDGYRPRCKQCRKGESKDYYWRNPEMQREKCAEYRQKQPEYGAIALRKPYYCSRCGQTKDASVFNIDRRRRFGHYPFCNECRKDDRIRYAVVQKKAHKRAYLRSRDRYIEKARLWVEANPDRHRSIRRLHSQKRRAWKLGSDGTFTQKEWIALCEQYDNRCLCCGEQKSLTVDHIVPLSRGGSNAIGNLQPLCSACNSHKFTQTIDYRYETHPPKEINS